MINIIGVLVKGGRYFYRLDLSDGAKQPVELFHQTDAPPNTPRVVARFYNWDAPIEQRYLAATNLADLFLLGIVEAIGGVQYVDHKVEKE